MTFFIPENFIYFYVFGSVDGLLSTMYGSANIILNQNQILSGINAYDVVYFTDHKILWGRFWKYLYFKYESPFRINLALNDRFNWAYSHTTYKLLSDVNSSIFLSKLAGIKGFYESPHNIVYNFNTFVTNALIYDQSKFAATNVTYFDYVYTHNTLMDYFDINTGLAHSHTYNHIAILCSLIFKDYNFFFMEFYNAFIQYVYIYLHSLCSSFFGIYLYIFFIIIFIFFFFYIILKKVIYFEDIDNTKIFKFLSEVDSISYRYINGAAEYDTKSVSSLVIFFIGYFLAKSYSLIDLYTKLSIFLIYFKKLTFNFFLKFEYLILFCFFKDVYSIIIAFYTVFFLIFELIFWNIKYLVYPFRNMVHEYVGNYTVIFIKHLNYWFYLIILFIVEDVRNDSVKGAILGWIKWTQVSSYWDEFVENEWVKLEMINLQKEIEEQQKKKDNAEDDKQRFILRDKKLSEEDIERIIKYQQSVRAKKRQKVRMRSDLRTSFKEYKQKHNIDEDSKNKDKSYLWSRLYAKYIFPLVKKEVPGLTKEEMMYEKPITQEFVKHLSYYNWLMDRKYLLFKHQYTYYDFADFMGIQQDMLKYYYETALFLKVISKFTRVFSYFYNTDKSFYSYAFFEEDFFVNMTSRIDLGSDKFYAYYMAQESKFLLKFFIYLLKIFKIFNLFYVVFFYMISYLLFVLFYILGFIKFILSCNHVTLKYYIIILENRSPKEYLWIFFVFYKLFFVIKFIKLNLFLSFEFLINIITSFFIFLRNTFSNVYYFIKTFLFDVWYFLFSNWFKVIDKFKRFFVFFVFLYFFIGLTPFDVFDSLFSYINLFIFEFVAKFTISADFISLRSNFFFFFVSDLYTKWLMIVRPYMVIELWYLNNMFDINIYVYFIPILNYIGYILIFPVFLAVNYTPYINFVTTWYYYDLSTLEVLNYLIKQEITREMAWRSENFFKTLFGGFLYHPIYRLIKDANGERMILFKYLWYDVFTLNHRLQISDFLIALPGYISVYPYWVLRYGAYYVVWRYNEQDISSKFLNVSINYAIFWFYLRWHVLGWLMTFINFLIFFPSKIFFLPLDCILNLISNSSFINYILKLIFFYLKLIVFGLGKYYVIFNIDYLFNWILSSVWVYAFLCIEYSFKGMFYFYVITMYGLKISVHFFQCIIPFLRYVLRYDAFIYIMFIDIVRSIFSIILIVYYIFQYFLGLLCDTSVLLFKAYSNWFFGMFFGNFVEFFYKSILYPYFVVYLDGFFDYYGKHGLLFGSGNTSFYNVVEFVDVVDHIHTRSDYTSFHRRWSLVSVDGYNGIDYSFIFRTMISYREMGAATAFYQIYIWLWYVIFLFILCAFSGFINKYIKHKDNVMPDSTYMWYKFATGNKFNKLSRYELMWLTQNKWLFSFYNIKGIIKRKNDIFHGLDKTTKKLSNFMFDHVEKSVYLGRLDAEYNKYVNHLLAFGTHKYSKLIFGKEKKYENYIRYYVIYKKIESLYKAKVFSTPFAKELLATINFSFSKRGRIIYFDKVAKTNKFFKFCSRFIVPIIVNNKYNYGLFRFFGNKVKYRNYFKALKLIMMHKENDKFKDLHDFYFLEHDFYVNITDNWLYGKSKRGNLLKQVITSRESNRMVYSSKFRTSLRLFDKIYLKYMDNFIGNLINWSHIDDKWLNGLLNFRMHNIFNSDRVVSTQLTAKEIERKVLEEYTDFMEVGWEQDKEEDGVFGVYKYLSDRLYESFLDNEDVSTEFTKFLDHGIDLSKKLALRNYYTPLADHWLGLSIILPLIVSLYTYKYYIFFSNSFPYSHPWYHYELAFFLVYFIYYIHPHFFYATMGLRLMFFPKLFTRRRKLRSFAASRLLSVVEKFFPNDELLKILINFSAYSAVFIFIFPTYDFIIFYIIFVVCMLVFYKLAHDLEI